MSDRTLTSRELRRLGSLSASRHTALREIAEKPVSDLHLHSPIVHKQVINHLFVLLLTSPFSEVDIAQEFWTAYRHLVENRPIQDLQFNLINREDFVSFFNVIKSSESDKTLAGVTHDDADGIERAERFEETKE